MRRPSRREIAVAFAAFAPLRVEITRLDKPPADAPLLELADTADTATTESTLQSMGAPYPPSQVTREPKLTAEEKAEVQARYDVWEATCKPRDCTDATGNTRVVYAKPGKFAALWN